MGKVHRLKRRREFIKVAQQGKVIGTSTLILQFLPHEAEAENQDFRVGFTASRRVGNAVKRNRARRRLREAVCALLPQMALKAADIVIIAKPKAVVAPYEHILKDMTYCFTQCQREYA